jgi:hypothetical protein
MNKLDAISEAEAPVDAQRAAYDKFRADDAKKAAVDAVKKMTAPNGNSNYIDPKDGVIKYMDNQNGRGGGEGSVKEFPYDWFKKGQEKTFFDQLKAAGLEVIPVERKQLFGTTQVAGVDLAKLATLGQEPAADPAVNNATSNYTGKNVNSNTTAIKNLNDLAYKLSITKGAAPAAKAVTPAGASVAFQPQGKGPAYGGYSGGGKSTNEGIEFKSDIAKNLIESFGYEHLDEITLPKGLGTAADSIGNAWTGAKNWFGGFGKGVSNPRSTNLPNVANGTNATSAGIRTGAAFGGNPGKLAAGSALLGGGAAMLAANGGNQPATVEVPGVSTQPEVAPAPAPAPAPAGGGPTPEQLEIIKQMQEIMKQLADAGTPEANQAISNAQEQISKITASPAQAALDSANAQSDRDALDAAVPATGKPGETNMAQTAATAPTAASIISNSPAVQASQPQSAGATAPVATNAASLRAAQDQAAGTRAPVGNEIGGVAEGIGSNESSDELARWLRIARGR